MARRSRSRLAAKTGRRSRLRRPDRLISFEQAVRKPRLTVNGEQTALRRTAEWRDLRPLGTYLIWKLSQRFCFVRSGFSPDKHDT